jgi:hypothetical protein
MGWVEDKFSNRVLVNRALPQLWNAMRDSIGQAVLEYNSRVAGTGQELSSEDCKSNGRFCRRIEKKIDGGVLEVYLDTTDATLKVFQQPSSATKAVCSYRLHDSGLEFFLAMPNGDIAKTPDAACQMAMDEFLFKPFPRQFSNHPEF